MSVLSKELEMPHGLERMAAHGAACFSLKGKTVLVTGASGDIGAYVSQTAAAAGARVVLAARREERLSQVADTIAARGGSVTWVPLDLTDRESIDSCVAAAGEIDVLVNNAGVARPAPALIGGGVGEEELWRVNLFGAIEMARQAARCWIETKRPGNVVNVASILGVIGAPGVSGYSATKAALISFTRTLACEWAPHDIRVNALAPGYLRTELNKEELDGDFGAKLIKRIPMRRFATLPDLNGPFLLLASDASRYMTGSVLVVDGGQTAC